MALPIIYAPPDHQHTQYEPVVVVPFVEGMLRPETETALNVWGGCHGLWPLDRRDPYAYATLMAQLWNHGSDLIVIEQDMVPTPQQISSLIACPEQWCSHFYHVGAAVYTTGLGFCKFSAGLQSELPLAAMHASTHPRKGGGLMPWQGVNEAIERAICRRHIAQHVHDGNIVHLHYPEPEHAG